MLTYSLDPWEQRWSDPALRELGRWLVAHEISDVAASVVVDGVWIFYSEAVVSAALSPAQHHIPVAISAQSRVGLQPKVWITIPKSTSPFSPFAIPESAVNTLRQSFGKLVKRHVAHQVCMQLAFANAGSSEYDFGIAVQQVCREQHSEFLGLFRDRLVDELKNVVGPNSFDYWYTAPNTRLAGESPRQAIDTPEGDRALRQMLLAYKLGIPAT